MASWYRRQNSRVTRAIISLTDERPNRDGTLHFMIVLPNDGFAAADIRRCEERLQLLRWLRRVRSQWFDLRRLAAARRLPRKFGPAAVQECHGEGRK